MFLAPEIVLFYFLNLGTFWIIWWTFLQEKKNVLTNNVKCLFFCFSNDLSSSCHTKYSWVTAGLSGVNRHNLWHWRFEVSSLNYQNSEAVMFYYLKTIHIFFIFFLEALVFFQEIEGHALLFLYVCLIILLDKCLFLKISMKYEYI